MYLDNDTCIEKRVAREILSIIENICFSDEFKEYKTLEKMIFETDVLENNMIEVDCFDKELAN